MTKRDYIKEVDDSLWHAPDEQFEPKTKKVLRRLVREAVMAAIKSSKRAKAAANRIARRLVP